MLALSKKADYGLIALCHLANHRENVVTAREIAALYRLPHPLLMNILKQLCHNGLLRSVRGKNGGYELAREPEAVTLAELIEGLEGPVRFVQCAAMDRDTTESAAARCDLFDVCPVSGPVRRLHRKLKQFLEITTLADIAFDSEYGVHAVTSGIGVMVAGREMTR